MSFITHPVLMMNPVEAFAFAALMALIKVFQHHRAMPVLCKMLEMIGLIVAINCKAGYHRTSAFVALLSAVLSAT